MFKYTNIESNGRNELNPMVGMRRMHNLIQRFMTAFSVIKPQLSMFHTQGTTTSSFSFSPSPLQPHHALHIPPQLAAVDSAPRSPLQSHHAVQIPPPLPPKCHHVDLFLISPNI